MKKTTEAQKIRSIIGTLEEAVQPYNIQGTRAEFKVQRTVTDTIEVTFDIGEDSPNVARVDFDSELFGENEAVADPKSAMDIFQTIQAVIIDFYDSNKGNFVGFNYEPSLNNKSQRMRIYDSLAIKLLNQLTKSKTAFFFEDNNMTYVLFVEDVINIWGQDAYNELVNAYGDPI
ncbi:hypothetical protein NVP2275O_048 [Vibrio phage 2.275.O._10N.286.54.E11]|nr:hypothetical protein NVP2275O_048 [Vibrio phage 2.275.O._10N.286.54.E11]